MEEELTNIATKCPTAKLSACDRCSSPATASVITSGQQYKVDICTHLIIYLLKLVKINAEEYMINNCVVVHLKLNVLLGRILVPLKTIATLSDE